MQNYQSKIDVLKNSDLDHKEKSIKTNILEIINDKFLDSDQRLELLQQYIQIDNDIKKNTLQKTS